MQFHKQIFLFVLQRIGQTYFESHREPLGKFIVLYLWSLSSVQGHMMAVGLSIHATYFGSWSCILIKLEPSSQCLFKYIRIQVPWKVGKISVYILNWDWFIADIGGQ